MRERVGELLMQLEAAVERLGLGVKPDDMIIMLDDDHIFLDIIKHIVKDKTEFLPVHDADEFKTVLANNGEKRLYVDIMMPKQTGIQLIEEMGPHNISNKITFISGQYPSDADIAKIEAMGASFMLKDEFMNTMREKYL
jgi:DNA-binding NtrC family response regulator